VFAAICAVSFNIGIGGGPGIPALPGSIVARVAARSLLGAGGLFIEPIVSDTCSIVAPAPHQTRRPYEPEHRPRDTLTIQGR